jgi:hypothetical protein
VKPLHCANADAAEVLHAHIAIPFAGEDAVPEWIMVMPAGTHTINASMGGKPVKRTILVDRAAAAALQQSLGTIQASSQQRAYFDFNHEEAEASGWPAAFEWRDAPQPGVYAKVEWSKAGREAIAGRMFRSFSPAFLPSKDDPARVIGAPLNMGGLVNEPAFKKILPIWAKQAADPPGDKTTTTKGPSMTPEEIAALQAKLKQLEQDNDALKAKAASENVDAAIKAKDAEIAGLKAKEAELHQAIKAQRAKEADGHIKAAIARGALPIKDEAIQAKWRGLLEADPSNLVLLEALPGAKQLTQTLTGGRAEITREDSRAIMARFEAEKDPLKRGLIYAKELRARLNDPFQVDDVIMAADTYSTTLVVQRVLDLLKWNYPILGAITSDFSPEAASYGDAITTRTIGAPTVGTYNTTTGYATGNATTADVAVTMNAHKFVQVSFNANVVASTRRKLYDEQVQTSYNGLAKDLSDALLALVTTANFTNTPIDSALVDFDRTTLVDLGVALTVAKVPIDGRTVLLTPTYYGKLAKDTSIVSALVNVAAGGAIATGRLPRIHGFDVIEQANLPTTGNLVAFGFNPSALVLATRTPGDYAAALPTVTTAALQIVTNPEDGFSVLMTQYVDHTLGQAIWRIAIMYGVAKGQVAAGTIIRSGP